MAYAINNRGQVVGAADTQLIDHNLQPVAHAFIWQRGMVSDLSAGSSDYSAAYAINAMGDVVGEADVEDHTLAAAWFGGRIKLLPRQFYDEEAQLSSAYGINDSRQIVGQYTDFWASGDYAAAWDGGKARRLDHGCDRCAAMGINNAGRAVGWEWDGGDDVMTLWAPGIDRHPVRSRRGESRTSYALAINNRGQVAGILDDEAVLWSANKLLRLGRLTEGQSSEADAVNDRGVVVGASYTTGEPISPLMSRRSRRRGHVAGQTAGAFVWERNRGMRDLNALIPADSGWHLDAAFGINNAGQIVGSGQHSGSQRGYLLTPRRQ